MARLSPQLLPARRRARRGLSAGLAAAAMVALLAGCSGEKWGFPYRASVQQGNWITQEQVATLQEGMTREQVRFVLGSPTLTSVLHADRWDYPYFYQPGTGDPQQRLFTVWFENDRLVRWQGDEQPEVQPFQQAERDVQRSRRESADDTRQQERDGEPATRATAPAAEVQQSGEAAATNPSSVPAGPGSAPEPLR